MSEVVEVPVLPNKPGKPPLDAVMNGQLQVEKWETKTRQWHRVLVVVSVGMAYRLFAGAERQAFGVKLVLCLWLATFVALFVCAKAGWRSQKRLDRMLAAVGARRRRPSGDA